MQRKHLAVDARERAAQAAVVGIESGGGFRHDRRTASTHARRTAFASAASFGVRGKAEGVAVFHRKLREGVVEVSGFHLLCDPFESDCASGLWQWRPVDDELLRLSATRCRGLSATTFLRAADGLHLACAAEEGCTAIHTSDHHMIAAAPAFGLQAVTL